jgi:hypothetical protein
LKSNQKPKQSESQARAEGSPAQDINHSVQPSGSAPLSGKGGKLDAGPAFPRLKSIPNGQESLLGSFLRLVNLHRFSF